MQPMTVKEIAQAVDGVWWNPREGAEPVRRCLYRQPERAARQFVHPLEGGAV